MLYTTHTTMWCVCMCVRVVCGTQAGNVDAKTGLVAGDVDDAVQISDIQTTYASLRRSRHAHACKYPLAHQLSICAPSSSVAPVT